jgi:hypothetical protein
MEELNSVIVGLKGECYVEEHIGKFKFCIKRSCKSNI